MTTAAVVVAAGEGVRLQAGRPKALVELDGVPLVAHAVDRLLHAGIDEVVVVGPAGHLDRTAEVLGSRPATVVAGGATRSASVRHGLAALGDDALVVAVHDAARALTPSAVIAATVEALVDDVVAAAPGLPVTDTLKRVTGAGSVQTVSRDGLVAIQTPQAFRREVLERAHAGGEDASDDLGLVERLLLAGAVSGRIVITEGSPLAIKITYEQDMHVAAALLRLDRS